MTVARPAFCGIKRKVGITNQFLARLAVKRADGDADRHTAAHRYADTDPAADGDANAYADREAAADPSGPT